MKKLTSIVAMKDYTGPSTGTIAGHGVLYGADDLTIAKFILNDAIDRVITSGVKKDDKDALIFVLKGMLEDQSFTLEDIERVARMATGITYHWCDTEAFGVWPESLAGDE